MTQPKESQTLEGRFEWNTPQIQTTFPQGEDAQELYQQLGGYITRLGDIQYNPETKTIIGSTPFLSARIDTLVRPLGLRTTNLRDLSRPEVMQMIKDNHYADAPILVLRTTKDSYERNQSLINQLTQQIEEANGKLELPVMISGFDVQPSETPQQGYGIEIVPRADFQAISDERLAHKNNGKRFTNVDELGLPIFDKNGTRTFYTRNQGLSRLYLDGDLDLGSGDENLSYSNSNGRVVVVSAEGTEGANSNFLESFSSKREEFEKQQREHEKGSQRLREEINRILEG